MKPSTILSVALLALSVPSVPLAAFEVEILHESDDRPRVVLARRDAPTVTLIIRFETGGVDDQGLSGLTRLSQHALLAANRRLDLEAFLADVYASAGVLRVETGLRSCQFVLTAHREAFWPLARRLAEAVLAPRLDPAALPRAVARALHEATPASERGALTALVATTALVDGRYRNRPAGDRQVIESLEPSDVDDHVASRLAPANASVVLAGGFRREDAVAMVKRYRGGRPFPVERPVLTLPVSAPVAGMVDVLVVAFPISLRTPRQTAVARVLARAIERELWTTLRDAGAGYEFLVAVMPSPWLDLLVVSLPSADQSRLALRPHLLRIIEKLRSGPLEASLLAASRAEALAQLRELDRHPEELARALAEGGEAWHGREVADLVGSLDGLGAVHTPWLDPVNTVEIRFGRTQP